MKNKNSFCRYFFILTAILLISIAFSATASAQAETVEFTQEESDYIASAPILNVATAADVVPIEYYDEASGSFKGITQDLFGRITELSRLQFNFVPRGETSELVKQIEDGTIQLVGTLANTEGVAAVLPVKITDQIIKATLSLVSKDPAALTAESIAAVPAGYPVSGLMAKRSGYNEVKPCADFEACVAMVGSGEADLTYIISLSEAYLLADYADLQSTVVDNMGYGMSMGIANGADADLLLSIINKCLAAIPDSEREEIISSNIASAIQN